MKQSLKQRLVGAVVLVALAVIFLPMLLTGPVDRSQVSVPVEIPPKPQVQPSSQLPQPDDETATRPPPESITQAPEPVDGPEQPSAEADGQEQEADAGSDEAPAPPDNDGQVANAGADAGSDADVAAPAPDAGTAAEDPQAVPEQGDWAVQVGGFRNRSNALGLREKLRGEGYTVYVDQAEWKGKPLYRVRVGPVLSEQEAATLKARLKRDEGLDGLVVSR